MKFWAIALALAVAAALLPSCQEKSETTRRIVVTAVGIDAGEDGRCRLSIQAIESLKTSGSLTEQEDNPTVVYETEGMSVAGALDAFVAQTGRSTYTLHNRAVVVSLEQAKKLPLSTILDYFIRNHEGRSSVDVVLCRGEAAELLAVPSAGYTIPSDQLAMLVQEGWRQGYAVVSDLLSLERSASGMFDAALPILRVDGEGEDAGMMLDGTALFRQGVYAGELDESGTKGLLFGRDDMKRCQYDLRLPDKEGNERRITLQIENSHTRVEIQPEGLNAAFRLAVSCEAYVAEEAGELPLGPADLPALEEALGEAVRLDTEEALDKSLRQWDCDVYGFTRMTKKKAPQLIRGFEDTWPQRLRDSRFTVEAEAKVELG